jgi:hypothetical protein
VQALKEETMEVREKMVEGELVDIKRNLLVEFDGEDENPPKKLKGVSGSKSECESSSGVVCLSEPSGNEVKQAGDFDEAEWDWMGDFDWEGDLQEWQMGKLVQVNPISALFGKLINCPGLTINWSGNVNFKS